MKKHIIFLTAVFCITLTSCSSTDSKPVGVQTEFSSTSLITTAVPAQTIPAPIPKDASVRVFAAGDNLIHEALYKQAKERANGDGYNFDYAYQYVEDLVSPADLAVLNQETPIANQYTPSTYPQFNSPDALGDKVIEMGFNAISHANNHILDKGESGLISTLDFWKSRSILTYGAYPNEEELNSLPILEINGIRFSFLGFMEHTNGLKLPAASEARLVYTSEKERMQSLIQRADEISDVVVVSIHWGVEITNTITQSQFDMAKDFVDWGADLILGTQPHTVQSMEYLDKPEGGQAFVAYSMGNFISAQERNLAMLGVALDMNITKSASTGEILITDMKAIPLVTHYDANFANVRVYPYALYTEELALSHGTRERGEFSLAYCDQIFRANIPEEFFAMLS